MKIDRAEQTAPDHLRLSAVANGGSLTIPEVGLRDYVLDLARRCRVKPQKTWSDQWAENVTRLADDEVKTDDIEDLVIALKKAKQLTNLEMVQLLANYLREKESV